MTTEKYTRTSKGVQWIAADAADLAAIVVLASEMGCYAYQVDTQTLYVAYRSGSGATIWQIVASVLELLKFVQTAAAVNELTITNAATGNPPTLAATGDDTNISLKLLAKGTGVIDCSVDGIRSFQAVTNVHDTTPTDAELDTAFGTPATVGRGFIGTVDDNDASAISYICWCTDANWFFIIGTKAT